MALINLLIAENGASRIARLNEAPINPRKSNLYQIWQRFYWRPTKLVVVGLLSDAFLASGYQWNPFNIKNFSVNSIELKRNNTPRPTDGNSQNFANCKYIKGYSTWFQELKCDTYNKSVSFTTSEYANKYALYAFKINDGFIGPGMCGPRTKSATVSSPKNLN